MAIDDTEPLDDSANSIAKGTRKRSPKLNKRLLNTEVASYGNDITLSMPLWDNHYRLYSKDSLLLAKSGSGFQSLKLYIDLLTDPQVMYCLSKQTNEITSRPWLVRPASDSEQDLEIAEFVTENLKQIGAGYEDEVGGAATISSNDGFDAVVTGMAGALVVGYYPAEIVWTRGPDGRAWAKDVKMKDPRRFTFIGDIAGNIFPRLLTATNGYAGESLPPRKFIFNRYWSHLSEDPFGAGLGRQIYYPVTWKRQALSFWLNFTDKSTTPVAVGTYPPDAEETEIRDFFMDLSNMGQETAIVMPEGWDVKYLESKTTEVTDAYSGLIEYCDKAISLAMLGEATTGQETEGSQAKDTISNSIRVMKAKGLSDSINATLNNTLIRWIVYLNWGKGVKPPTLERSFENLDSSDQIGIVTQVSQMGFKPDRDYISQRFNIPLEPEREKPDQLEEGEIPVIDPPVEVEGLADVGSETPATEETETDAEPDSATEEDAGDEPLVTEDEAEEA